VYTPSAVPGAQVTPSSDVEDWLPIKDAVVFSHPNTPASDAAPIVPIQ